ncbi:LysR family transcriptional regulator [Vogesella sp. LIG4]|uniref:LysR family transcriptional regulator n=1 Tax=Vogesella sp. LIG4 TaxID=1192162 RepID=UPI00081F7C65|nr:LysR family transcriptional regulator [Vogesella sp. LIG4]SCK26567.1 transcriptional regulator, LysR family [Vogesella sp. LIG4]
MKSVIAQTQYNPQPADLALILALVRTGNLAAAGERLGVDPSTVFRALQRIERAMGRSLFARTRSGYQPAELALQLAEHAEKLETILEAAHATVAAEPEQVAGSVLLTTTDTVLHGLVAPAMRELCQRHPLLCCAFHTGNELASLTRRDADIAIRATRRPPPHLVGKQLGHIRVAIYGPRHGPAPDLAQVMAGQGDWVAPDDALPEHPSVLWRKRHLPKVVPRHRVNSILSVMELVALGMGVGIAPLFIAEGRHDLVRLSEPLVECETELWLLTHPESRHLRRIATVYSHLAQTLQLP